MKLFRALPRRTRGGDRRGRLLDALGRLIAAAMTLGALAFAFASPAAAQSSDRFVRPWMPPATDSVNVWATEARARFQAIRGDSATGPNQRAYDLVGKIARRLLQTMRREEWTQAPVIERALDSLALDTDVVLDPKLADFLLLVVRNPFHPEAEAVGYLFWHRDTELRYQGVVLSGGEDPRMKVWWTARPDGPYEWGILSHPHRAPWSWELVLLRLYSDGSLWRLLQIEDRGLDLGGGQVAWADLDGDDRPEIVTWSADRPDSAFQTCAGCPRILVERTFTEHDQGFELHDSRIVPSPWSSFVLFVDLLRHGNRAGASRLLRDPTRLQAAVAAGWGLPSRGIAWKLEYTEANQPWPRWLAIRHLAGKGRPLYIVHFALQEGRWIIRDWARSVAPRPPGASKEGTAK